MSDDEGPRCREHPGIVFRAGPSGRRAGLVGGPDVWEVAAVRSTRARSDERAITAVAEELSLTPGQVTIALEYYGAFPEEIDAQIAENGHAARQALEAWRARRALLA